LRFLPDGTDRKAGEIRQVGGPRTHKEVSSFGFGLETVLRPFVGTGLIVAIYVNRAVPSVVLPEDLRRIEPVEFELLFKFWDGFVPPVPALLHSEYTAPH
jgi:hypothetical protein